MSAASAWAPTSRPICPDLPLDEPIPESRLPKSANLHKAFFDGIMKIIREENPTLRQLYLRYERGRKTIKGTPAHIADVMEEWFTMGATDGFMMQFATLPGGLQDFVTLVVPELQRRGLFRTEYAGTTLRDHLGLARPGQSEYRRFAPRTPPSSPTSRRRHRSGGAPLRRRLVEPPAVAERQHALRQAGRFPDEGQRAVPVEVAIDRGQIGEGRRLGEQLEGQAMAGIVGVQQVAREGQKLAAVLGHPVLVDRVVLVEPGLGLRARRKRPCPASRRSGRRTARARCASSGGAASMPARAR